tara:strand:+ start:291 stop:1781 length:1491 start_codon:yes stop_codon:yes gene_type:complete
VIKDYKQIIGNYFDTHSFVESNVKSFDHFVDKGMQKIVNEVGDIIPTIIPQEVENFKIKLGKINVEKPQIIEADGSKRDIYPMEARIRKLTYAAPINMEVSAHMDNIQRESFTALVGKLPIMLHSKHCHLNGLRKDSMVEHGEDPEDLGGYFILNGNERVLIMVEDLASNKLFVSKQATGPSKYTAKLFSEKESYRIPHTFEQMKDGIIYLSFSKYKRIPIISIIKALGLIKDQEIVSFISEAKNYDEVFVNLYNHVDLRSERDALEYLSKRMGISHLKEQKTQRVREQLDKYLLPHIGTEPKDRIAKAYHMCKLLKRFLMVSKDGARQVDKDHYMNKRLKLSGDLLSDLFRVNLRSLVQDMLYNFQRIVKRGKFQSIRIIIRDQLMTTRIKSAMATGTWVGGKKGISQNIDRTNAIATLSNLQRIASLLTTSQENFEARALHPTHWMRVCPVETPEGTPIGLRKNTALMCEVTQTEQSDEKVKRILENSGVNLAV